MANPSRKMVTMRRIDRIEPIEGADFIEAAVVGGWRVVVKKGEFKEGDLALYHEIDSFIDVTRPEYSFLDANKEMEIDGEVRKGHVLRTKRMRGVYSQGLLLDPHQLYDVPEQVLADMCDSKADLSAERGVVEYVRPVSMQGGKKYFIGRYDPYIGPRTDAERIQNIDLLTYRAIQKCAMWCSLKIDGTSTSLLYDERRSGIRIFSHNNEYDCSIDGGLGMIAYRAAERQGLIDLCESNPMMCLQAELIGPKIQGNRYGLNDWQLWVFSVWDVQRGCYHDPYTFFWDFAKPEARRWLAPNLNVSLMDFDTPDDLLAYADGMRGNLVRDRLDEGLVAHIIGRGDTTDDEWLLVRNALSQTMQVKAVSNRFLMKAKE